MDRVGNFVAKGEIAHYENHTFATIISKGGAAESSKSFCKWERAYRIKRYSLIWNYAVVKDIIFNSNSCYLMVALDINARLVNFGDFCTGDLILIRLT